VLVMTGGPGVGKTTIVKAILRILAAKSTNLLLCAPTGRVAALLSAPPQSTDIRPVEVRAGLVGFMTIRARWVQAILPVRSLHQRFRSQK
jgi:energy-coupling factor transporter ATP-binding protein EcfA2